MKKIVKLFILMCVCFIPVMVDAKANFEFKNEFVNEFFFNEENGEYFYIDLDSYLDEMGSVVIYDKNGNFLREDKFSEEDYEFSSTTVPNSKYFEPYYKLYIENNNAVYNEEDGILYDVIYYSESFGYYDSDENYIEIGFNEDLEFTKRLLGKKYDAYLKTKEYDVEVNRVIENNGYFIVYYDDSELNSYVTVFDKDFKIIKTFEEDIYSVYIYDDLVYAMTSPTVIDVYKLDGSLLEKLTISHDSLNNTDSVSCGDLVPYMLYIENNELFIMYGSHSCIYGAETNDFSMEKAKQEVSSHDYLTLVYSLNYDVNKVESSNGDFTYTSKFDDEGREYVELNIVPKDGYSVEDIIVTDINGKRIEVTNNKFYMPASDVNIDVKFFNGEYIPIPDTFSEMSPLVKVLSILLIGCGMCIMRYSLRSKKVK